MTKPVADELSQMILVDANVIERIQKASETAFDLAEKFRALGEAARRIEIPTIAQIARGRMHRLQRDHGLFRFFMPSWWRWWSIALDDEKAGEA